MVRRLGRKVETDRAGAHSATGASRRDVAMAVVASISPNRFIEKVKLLVTKRAAAGEVIVGDDLAALIDRAATDPQLHELLAADLAPFLLAAQSLLPDADEADLRRSAGDGKWDAAIGTAAQAPRSRLTTGDCEMRSEERRAGKEVGKKDW